MSRTIPTRWTRPATLALLAPLALGGCPKNLPNLGNLQPSVRFHNFQVQEASFEGLQTRFVLEVDNPLPVGVDVSSLSWNLAIAGHDFLDGERGTPVQVASRSSSRVRLPVGIQFADLYQAIRGVQGKDELPWHLTGTLQVDTPAGPLRLPFSREGVMPALQAPKVSVDSIRVAGVNLLQQTATVEVSLGVENQGKAPLNFERFAYDLGLGGSKVASGTARISSVSTKQQVVLPVDLQLLQLGQQVVQAITQKTPVKVDLSADTVIDTELGAIPLKLERSATLSPK